MKRALENTSIQGVETNVQFLIAMISDHSFVGDQLRHVTIKSLEQRMDSFIEATVQLNNQRQKLAKSSNSSFAEAASVATTTSSLQFKSGDAFNIEISNNDTTEASHSFRIDSISTNNFPDQFVGHIQTSIPSLNNPLAISVTRKSAVGSSSTLRRKTNPRAPTDIGSPVTGMVVEINVKEGDRVEPGQQLFVMSAMKMETVVHSSLAGIVKTIYACANDLIEDGDVVIELESNDSKL